jgi:hypothetical protein
MYGRASFDLLRKRIVLTAWQDQLHHKILARTELRDRGPGGITRSPTADPPHGVELDNRLPSGARNLLTLAENRALRSRPSGLPR